MTSREQWMDDDLKEGIANPVQSRFGRFNSASRVSFWLRLVQGSHWVSLQ